MAYNKNTDYQKLINDAVAKGDYSSAARYEQQRNEKIGDLDKSGTNTYGATATNKYSSYLNGGNATSGPSGSSLSRNPSYTPNDSSGNDYAGMVGMSDIDRAALDAASNSWYDAKARGDQAAMDAAHAQAESIRQKYGYSGGSDGSQYIIGFQYEQAPEYVSQFQEMINSTLEKHMNRDPFVYDPMSDPLYQQYADSYARTGGRAMEDALGIIAAQTGGLASSYAATAAQQTYGKYMQELNDMIPELQQLAYNMYLNDGKADMETMNLLMGLENMQYGQYLDSLGQWNTDRDFAYGQFRDDIGDDQYTAELEWAQNQSQMDRLDAENKAKAENAWKKIQSGAMPTPEELELLEMDEAEARQMVQMMKMILMGYYG